MNDSRKPGQNDSGDVTNDDVENLEAQLTGDSNDDKPQAETTGWSLGEDFPQPVGGAGEAFWLQDDDSQEAVDSEEPDAQSDTAIVRDLEGDEPEIVDVSYASETGYVEPVHTESADADTGAADEPESAETAEEASATDETVAADEPAAEEPAAEQPVDYDSFLVDDTEADTSEDTEASIDAENAAADIDPHDQRDDDVEVVDVQYAQPSIPEPNRVPGTSVAPETWGEPRSFSQPEDAGPDADVQPPASPAYDAGELQQELSEQEPQASHTEIEQVFEAEEVPEPQESDTAKLERINAEFNALLEDPDEAAEAQQPHQVEHADGTESASWSQLETGEIRLDPTKLSDARALFASMQQNATAEHQRLTGSHPPLPNQGALPGGAQHIALPPGPAASRTSAPEPTTASAPAGDDRWDAPVYSAEPSQPYATHPAEDPAQTTAARGMSGALVPPEQATPAAAREQAKTLADERARQRQLIVRASEPDTEHEVAQAAINRVRAWIAQRNPNLRRDPAADRLAKLLDDPKGLEFAIRFIDRVVRTEDNQASAREFERLSRDIPDFLDWYLKFGISMGGGFGLLAPGVVVPLAKRALRSLVSHLVIDASNEKLGKRLAKVRESGVRLNINLLGEAVLGEQEAERRLEGTMTLLSRDDVDYVSVKVSALAPQLNAWGFQQTVRQVAERLMPLYRMAAQSETPKFINLDMEDYLDLDLTIAVFKQVMSQPELRGLEAGIVLQAYLPDALGALQDLTDWSRTRMDAGGAPIKVRVVKGANLAMERVESKLHGWPLATVESKQSADANFKRVLEYALRPENAAAVRVGIASHNLFDIAYGIELAERAGVRDRIDIEMLLGMASDHLAALKQEVPNVVLYTPVVHPNDFDHAVAYLVRRLEENAAGENFMSHGFDIGEDLEVFTTERDRFLDSLELMEQQDAAGNPVPNRTQDRSGALEIAVEDPADHDGFFNEPDTDPALAANRAWASRILDRATTTELGNSTLSRNHIDDIPTLDRRIRKIVEAAPAWRERGADARRSILHDAAVTLGAYRGRLIEIMAAETGKTVAEGDPEVSEAIDFCRYYGDQALELERFEHATPKPVDLTVVIPPWNFPTAIPVGGITAALATGSTVIIKPSHLARRTAAVLCEALWEAGVPREVLVLCDIADRDVSQHLISHEAVGRLILTGSSETAELFGSWRPDLPILAETSGKNAITVTPSADFDLAVDDIVHSAFWHAGQKCSAASVAVLVGSVGKSERFKRQLIDAVQSLRVGYPTDPQVHVGPVIERASGKLDRALTTLEEGESWLVEPRKLDDTGRLWSPGVRVGVQPGSFTHLTEFFGPHLSIIEVETLDDAIAVHNGTDFGLTAGIHALDTAEVHEWLEGVEAGNLYVNRGITGAIVRRQPFGGWKLSQVGPGAKAGGPNYLAGLVDWEPVFGRPKGNVKLVGLSHAVATVIEAATPQLDFLEFDRVRAGANSDQRAWETEFGVALDASELGYERNVLRYRPTHDVLVRLADDGTIGQLMRVLAAATRAGATIRVSSSKPLPQLVAALAQVEPPLLRMEHIMVESDEEFHHRVAAGGALAPITVTDEHGRERAGSAIRRIRLAGSDPKLAEVLGGNVRVALYDGPVSTEGRLELLPFMREQAVSVTTHRFGNLDADFVKLKL